MTNQLLRVAVIGAGVVGCLAVYGLQHQQNVEVICIEKGSEENELAGTGLNVGPNSLKILKQLSPELASSLQAVSLPWSSWKAGLTDGTVIFNFSLLDLAENFGIRIRWAQLYRQLRKQIPGQVRYNTIVASMGYLNPEKLYLEIEDSTTGQREYFEDIDLIVGCDGRYSQVRETFLGEPPEPEYLGACIYRLLVPNTADEIIQDYQQWFNNGSRLLTFAIPGDEVYIAGSFPLTVGLDIPESAKTPEFLRKCYTPSNGLSRECQFLVDAICDNIESIHWARIQDIPIAFRDKQSRVLCLGDASHAMYPTLGQGASQAFEDGCYFAALMRQAIAKANYTQSQVNIPALVAQVEAVRRDRIEFVKHFSRQASDSLLAGSNPLIELKAKTQTPFRQKLVKLYCDTPALPQASAVYL